MVKSHCDLQETRFSACVSEVHCDIIIIISGHYSTLLLRNKRADWLPCDQDLHQSLCFVYYMSLDWHGFKPQLPLFFCFFVFLSWFVERAHILGSSHQRPGSLPVILHHKHSSKGYLISENNDQHNLSLTGFLWWSGCRVCTGSAFWYQSGHYTSGCPIFTSLLHCITCITIKTIMAILDHTLDLKQEEEVTKNKSVWRQKFERSARAQEAQSQWREKKEGLRERGRDLTLMSGHSSQPGPGRETWG